MTTPSRPINRRDLMKTAAALGGLSLLPPLGPALAARPLTFGSASLGSTGYVIIEAISRTVNKYTDLRASSMSTSGGTENLKLIGEGSIDFGQSASTDWPAAVAGKGKFGKPIAVQQMFAYTVWATIPMVRADSDIKTARDLGGKRVSPSTAGGSTRRTWELMTGFLGVKDDIRWTYGSWQEIYDGFRAGAIDCVPGLLVGGRPSPLLMELQSTVPVRGLGWPDDAIAFAVEDNPGIAAYTAEPDLWSGVSEPTTCTASVGLLAANPKVSKEVGYEVTKAVFAHAAEVREISMELQNITPEFAVKYLMPSMPVHPGAAQYFQEIGVWRDDLKVAEG